MKTSIFEKRINYKPFEYPEVMQFVEAINKSFWVHSEVDFTSDIQDFHSNLSSIEKQVVKRSLLSIAQVEVGVKTFWGNIYNYFPKPEFNGLGATFAENEFRHSEAYSKLIEVLGYATDFEELTQNKVFIERINMVEQNLKEKHDILWKLLFFTIVIENSSLFSQFANILSFTKFRGYMKNVSNIIAWTSVDEQIHANAGIYLINEIQKEVDVSEKDKENLIQNLKFYIQYEEKLLDWIYEDGELDFFSKKDMLNFMKYRIDEALEKMQFNKIFNVSEEEYKPMQWFEEEINAPSMDDFFAKRPVDYTKHDKSITANDLF